MTFERLTGSRALDLILSHACSQGPGLDGFHTYSMDLCCVSLDVVAKPIRKVYSSQKDKYGNREYLFTRFEIKEVLYREWDKDDKEYDITDSECHYTD